MSLSRRGRIRGIRLLISFLCAVLVTVVSQPVAGAEAGAGYSYSYAAKVDGWQTTPAGDYGFHTFSTSACGTSKNGWYFYSRAKWRVKDAPGGWVRVDYVDVTVSTGKKAVVDYVWLSGADGTGVAGIVNGITFPAGATTTRRIQFPDNSNANVKWRSTHEITTAIDFDYAPASNTVYGCRHLTFGYALAKNWL